MGDHAAGDSERLPFDPRAEQDRHDAVADDEPFQSCLPVSFLSMSGSARSAGIVGLRLPGGGGIG